MPKIEHDSTLAALHDAYTMLLKAWAENEKLRAALGLKPSDEIPPSQIPSAIAHAAI